MATQPTPIGDQPGITPSTPTGPARAQSVIADGGSSPAPARPRATTTTVDQGAIAAQTPITPRATTPTVSPGSLPSAATAINTGNPQTSTTVTNNGLLNAGSTTTAAPQTLGDTNTVEQIVQEIIAAEPPRQVNVITNKPAGNINGEIQFYSNGNFAVDKDFKYDSSTDSLRLNGTVETVNLQVSGRAYLGNATNIWIGGGYVGQYLSVSTDGNLGWVSGIEGNTIGAGNSNVAIQPSGNITLSVGGVSNVLTVTTSGIVVTGNSNLGTNSNVRIGGGSNGQALTTDGAGNLSWTTVGGVTPTSIANGNSNVVVAANGNVTVGIGGTANVLTIANNELTVTGNLMPPVDGVYSIGNASRQWKELWITGTTIYIGGVPLGIASGNVLTVANAPVVTENTINTGDIETSANIVSNNVQTTTIIANGNIQSNGTVIAANVDVTQGNITANSFRGNNYILGNNVVTISNTRWLDAITNSTSPTVLFSTANTVSSIDVHITAVEGTTKQITKMLSVTSGVTTNYSQYGNVSIGGEIADFTMDQVAGQVRIMATAKSATITNYRLVITLYT